MLKKAHRLKSRGDFKRTLAAQRLCSNDCFVVYGLPAPPAASGQVSEPAPAGPRIGFIVSKKIHKRAVRRNRIKRRLRELCRTWLLTERPETASKFRTLVFIARTGSLSASYADLRQRLQRCFPAA